VQRPTPGEQITRHPRAWLVDDMVGLVADFQRLRNLSSWCIFQKIRPNQRHLNPFAKVGFSEFFAKFDYDYDCIILGSLRFMFKMPGKLFNITQPFRASQFPSLGQPSYVTVTTVQAEKFQQQLLACYKLL